MKKFYRALQWAEGSVQYAIGRDKEHFLKMFPNADYEGKFILWLNFGFYWPYSCESVDCMIRVCFDGKEYLDIDNFRVRHPYPNKKWYVACMKNGRRLSDAGIILAYDSFEELSKIKSVKAYWTVNDAIADGSAWRYNISVNYDLSFEQAEGKRSYTLISRERPLVSLLPPDTGNLEAEDFGDALDEYDNVYILTSFEDEEDYYCVRDIKGVMTIEDAFATWWASPDLDAVNLKMECYSSTEKMIAREASIGL